MATRISYQIGGKYDSTGEKKAIAGLKNLSDSAKKLNLLFTGFVGAKVLEGVNKVLDGAVENFQNQNKAVQNLNVSLSKNMNVTTKQADKLKDTLNDLGRNNFFDGDTLNNAAALASNMGLNAEQIESVMKAATDMTASGLMPMDQAIKALSQSYSGNITMLKRYAPQLSSLTKEELKQGDAVKLLAESYKGYADAISNTFSGRNTQFKNNFSDLQAAAGAFKASFDFLLQGKLMRPLTDLTNWLVENRDNILKFILAIPDLAKEVLKSITKIIDRTFTMEGLLNFGKMILKAMKTTIETIIDIIKLAVNTVFDLLDLTIGNVLRLINNAIAKAGNNLIETINEVVRNAAENEVVKFLMGLANINTEELITFRFDEKNLKTFEEFKSNLTSNVDTLIDNFKTAGQEYSSIFSDFVDYYAEDNAELVKNLKEVLENSDLPEDLKKALSNVAFTITTETNEKDEGQNGNNSENEKTVTTLEKALEPFTRFAASFTDLAKTAENLVMGFFSLLASIESVSKILNWTQTLLNGMFTVLTPLINSLLLPFVGFIDTVGQMLGQLLVPILESMSPLFSSMYEILASLLNLLQPVIGVIDAILYLLTPILALLQPFLVIINAVSTSFAALINLVLVPVGRAIGTVVDFLYNGIIHVVNGLISVINHLPWVNIGYFGYSNIAGSIGSVSTVTYTGSKLTTAGANVTGTTITGSSSASSSASYTGAQDITINIFYNQSYVNGDARAIAINLRNEIRSAEALGY